MLETQTIKGKRALVTGASSGLGRHFAKLLAKNGAHVFVAARRLDRLQSLVDEIESDGGTAAALPLDVTDPQTIDALFSETHYEIVVNNAGVTYDGPAMKTSDTDWDFVINTDLTGVFRIARGAASALVNAKSSGSIINISSILGLRVAGNLSAYATAKAGVVQMTKSLALEWARYGIRVNVICPGYIETDLNRAFFETDAGKALIKRVPQRRLGQMSDLDGPLLLLAADASGFMTGSEIVVDGGHLVSSL